jgi:hypothetical protein
MSLRPLGLLPIALLVLACAKKEAPPAEQTAAPPPAEPRMVMVTASEYAFTMPDTLTAGPTLFHLVGNGAEVHHLQIMRLLEGKTIADFAALPEGPPPPWVQEIGGPNAVRPGGGESQAALNLEAGNYVAVCFVPSPDGKPHIAKGMIKPFVVVAGSGPAGALPTADLTMTLTDYAFSLSAPITAGHHVIKVSNQAAQHHEVLFFRLAEGKTVKDLISWVAKMEGPPPGEPVGGTTGIGPNLDNYVIADFTPGEYGLFCFLPDAKDGKMHIEHGMVQQITIR